MILDEPSPLTLIRSSFTTTFVKNCDLLFKSEESKDLVCSPEWRIEWGTFKESNHEDVLECQVGRDNKWRYGTLLTCMHEKNAVKMKYAIPHVCLKRWERLYTRHSSSDSTLFEKILWETVIQKWPRRPFPSPECWLYNWCRGGKERLSLTLVTTFRWNISCK